MNVSEFVNEFELVNVLENVNKLVIKNILEAENAIKVENVVDWLKDDDSGRYKAMLLKW